MQTKRKGSLLFLIVLAVNLLFFVPLEVKAIDNNYWNLDFNSNIRSYSMPNGYSTDITKAHWNTLGYYEFNYSDCRMEGIFKPPDNIINYTFSIRFYHRKYKDNAGTQLADSQQLLFRLGTYTQLGTHDREFLTIMVGDADTNSPYLQMRVETYGGSGGSLTSYSTIQLAGGFTNNVWHTLIMTYCFSNQKIYAYFDNNYWTSESLPRTGSYIWPSNNVLYLDIGAWKNFGVYFNWFSGYIDYVSWQSVYTSSYQATQNILWYHLDDVCPPGVTELDSSGNSLHATLDTTKYQTVEDGKFGFAISGSNTQQNVYACAIPYNMPSITDKYTASFWWKPISSFTTVTGLNIVRIKPFRIVLDVSSSPYKYTFKLICNIGGSDRTLSGTQLLATQFTGNWLYFYAKYDGTNLRFSINKNWTTTMFNVTSAYSGTIADQPYYRAYPTYPNGQYGLSWEYMLAGWSVSFDEFKLTRNILSPFEMNTTQFGPPENITVITPISEDYWLKGYLSPNTYYLTPTNPTGTGTLMINSSGQFTLRMRDGYQSLYNIFDIYGFNATAWSMPASVYYITISFTMKNNTPSGSYFGQVNVTNSYGIPQSVFFGFTLIVSRTGEFINKTFPIALIIKNSPLLLRWDDVKTGQIYIFTNQSSMLCDYSSEYMDMSIPKWDSYKSIFDENDYVENLRDNLGNQYFKINYAVDSRILNYGNLTIYHYVRVYSRNNPEIYTILTLTINVQIKSSLYSSDKLWITVTPTTITGIGGASKQVELKIYSNKKKYVYWSPVQSYDSIRPEYVFCAYLDTGNYQITNYTVTVSVIIPQATPPSGYCTVKFTAYEVYNPLLQNYTTLTVTPISLGMSFDFSIIPTSYLLSSISQMVLFRATIATHNSQSDKFCLDYKTNMTFFSVSIDNVETHPWYLGEFSDYTFNIKVWAIGALKNGSYVIQFTAYSYNNLSNYVRRSVILQYQSEGIDTTTTTTTGTTTTTTITGTNLTLISIGDLIQVTGLGSGAVKDAFVAFSELSGMPIGLSSFLIGLLFVVVGIIGTALASKGLAPSGAYILVSLGITVFNTMAGIWSMWILMIFVLIGIVMLSTKIIGHFSGNKGSEIE